MLEELIEESKREKGIRWRCVCVREREESVLEELREESRGEKSIR